MKFMLLLTVVLGCYASSQMASAATCWTNNIENASMWVQSSSSYGYGSYSSMAANVQHLYYDTDYVYVYITSIPTYSIGPWTNPNTPKEQNTYYKFPRKACYNTDTANATALGTIALATNGVTLYNFWDAQYVNSVWPRNAYYWEGSSFDSCYGHCDATGDYHNHADPLCSYTKSNSSSHSPIIGWSLDGFPIYGPYCYSDPTDSTSAIKICKPCYSTRTYTNNIRSTFANGTATTYTVNVNSTYPIGSLIDDYECVSGNGDLDEYNGRWTVTPDFPSGIYAYFVNVDSSNTSIPLFPFIQTWYYKGYVASKYNYPSAMPTGKLTKVF